MFGVYQWQTLQVFAHKSFKSVSAHVKCLYIESLHLDPALSVHCEEGVVGDTPITEKMIMQCM